MQLQNLSQASCWKGNWTDTFFFLPFQCKTFMYSSISIILGYFATLNIAWTSNHCARFETDGVPFSMMLNAPPVCLFKTNGTDKYSDIVVSSYNLIFVLTAEYTEKPLQFKNFLLCAVWYIMLYVWIVNHICQAVNWLVYHSVIDSLQNALLYKFF